MATTYIPTNRDRQLQQQAARAFLRWWNAGAECLKEQQRVASILKPGEPVETKYTIRDNQIVNMHTGETVPFEEVVILRSRDNAVPQALEAYRVACERLGAPAQHITGAKDLLERVQSWREQNQKLCRLPGLRYLQQPPAAACCGGGSCASG